MGRTSTSLDGFLETVRQTIPARVEHRMPGDFSMGARFTAMLPMAEK